MLFFILFFNMLKNKQVATHTEITESSGARTSSWPQKKTYLISQGIEAFEDKLKQSLQILRWWGSNKYIAVPGEDKHQTDISASTCEES